LLEETGYRMLFKNFASSGVGLLGSKGTGGGRVLDRTTLVIEEGPDTDGGTQPAVFRKPRANWAYAAVGLALLFIALTAGYLYSVSYTAAVPIASSPSRIQNPRLVVLPFEAGDEAGRSLGIGFADALANSLGKLKQLEVLSAATG